MYVSLFEAKDYVHTVTFSSVFICVFTLKRMQTLSIYDRSCSLFNTLEIFSFGSCEQGVKTIQGTKTFLKTLENDARVPQSRKRDSIVWCIFRNGALPRWKTHDLTTVPRNPNRWSSCFSSYFISLDWSKSNPNRGSSLHSFSSESEIRQCYTHTLSWRCLPGWRFLCFIKNSKWT